MHKIYNMHEVSTTSATEVFGGDNVMGILSYFLVKTALQLGLKNLYRTLSAFGTL